MSSQVVESVERHLTDGALVQSQVLVDETVPLERVLRFESHFTVSALQGALIAVFVQNVHLEGLFGMECVAARLADEVSPREVKRDVALEVVVFACLIRAVWTLMGLDARVVAHVAI